VPQVSIKNVSKSFPRHDNKDVIDVLREFNLEIDKGEFVTFFGPNGCGKTTILNLVAGLLLPDKGIITINNKPPTDAKIGYVFQNFRESLFPWMRNIDNIAFPLEIRQVSKSERLNAVRNFIQKYDINLPLESYPYQLSGGQQQLIAILRALITNPDVLLMDEPFNGLDYVTKVNMWDNLIRLWMETKVTILFVSHDVEEALFLANRLIILTERPANIKKVLINTSFYPRNRKTLLEEKFLRLRSEALETFREELI